MHGFSVRPGLPAHCLSRPLSHGSLFLSFCFLGLWLPRPWLVYSLLGHVNSMGGGVAGLSQGRRRHWRQPVPGPRARAGGDPRRCLRLCQAQQPAAAAARVHLRQRRVWLRRSGGGVHVHGVTGWVCVWCGCVGEVWGMGGRWWTGQAIAKVLVSPALLPMFVFTGGARAGDAGSCDELDCAFTSRPCVRRGSTRFFRI